MPSIDGLLAAGDCVESYVGQAVHPDGTPVSFPPLHPHHLHVSLNSFHGFETHGDFALPPSFGLPPTNGYEKRLPKGFCFEDPAASLASAAKPWYAIEQHPNRADLPLVKQSARQLKPLGLNAVFNDVRNERACRAPAYKGAWEYSFYVQVQFRVATPPCRCKPVRLLWWMSPRSLYLSSREVPPKTVYSTGAGSATLANSLPHSQQANGGGSFGMATRQLGEVAPRSRMGLLGPIVGPRPGMAAGPRPGMAAGPGSSGIPCSRYVPPKVDQYDRYDVLNVSSMTWWSGQISFSGRMLLGDDASPASGGPWLHTHRMRYFDVLLVRGRPDEIGFRCSKFGIKQSPPAGNAWLQSPMTQRCAQQQGIAYQSEHALCADVKGTRDKLLQAAGSRVICKGDHTHSSHVSFSAEEAAAEGLTDRHMDRNGRLACVPWRFRRGDNFTMFAFHTPRWQPEVEHVLQHTNLFMWVEGDRADDGFSASFDAAVHPASASLNQCYD